MQLVLGSRYHNQPSGDTHIPIPHHFSDNPDLSAKMEKTKEEFVRLVKEAMEDDKSDSFVQLYTFLVGCFVRADDDMDGKVYIGDFDALIEEAAALPRRYGFAPKAEEMYKTNTDRKSARAKMFLQMNTAKDGYITLEEWMDFSRKHIMSKVHTLSKDILAGDNATKEEFVDFIKKAVNKSTPEYRDLYFFLLKCFTDADQDRDGAVNAQGFDVMIEKAAAAPRRYGLAPESSTMFKNEQERLAKHTEYFKKMDVKNNGTITFDEWLKFAVSHIMGKVATLV